MSDANSQKKPTRSRRQTLVVALALVCFVGVYALLARSLWVERSPMLDSNPAARRDAGDLLSPAEPAPPLRFYRDPDSPGRRF